ncbi:MAG: nucleotidyltransferase domain-containing protein [Candidatus Woesearchaeota archaeon]
MKFPLRWKEKKTVKNFVSQDLEVARKFAKIMYTEFGTFVSALIVFGSSIKDPSKPQRDIDILVILDDVKINFTRELVQTYRIITEKAIARVDPKRLHIQSMKFTSFWEYVRSGDPVAINILRHGVSLVDTGFFDPLQILLEQGRIRPSKESVYTYLSMSPASMKRSTQHMLTAAVDLYWAAIDAAHAALMSIGEIPPTPDHVADLLQRHLVNNKEIAKKYSDTMRKLYSTYKKITRFELPEISGKDYDKLKQETEIFINGMKKYIEKKK